MRIGRVVGTVVCTIKDPALDGKTMLLIQPIDRQGQLHGQALIALDSVGAGIGEDVFYVRGKEASFAWFPEEIPADCTVVGILDRVNFHP